MSEENEETLGIRPDILTVTDGLLHEKEADFLRRYLQPEDTGWGARAARAVERGVLAAGALYGSIETAVLTAQDTSQLELPLKIARAAVNAVGSPLQAPPLTTEDPRVIAGAAVGLGALGVFAFFGAEKVTRFLQSQYEQQQKNAARLWNDIRAGRIETVPYEHHDIVSVPGSLHVLEALRRSLSLPVLISESYNPYTESAGSLPLYATYIHGSTAEDSVLRTASVSGASTMLLFGYEDTDNVFIPNSKLSDQTEQVLDTIVTAIQMRRDTNPEWVPLDMILFAPRDIEVKGPELDGKSISATIYEYLSQICRQRKLPLELLDHLHIIDPRDEIAAGLKPSLVGKQVVFLGSTDQETKAMQSFFRDTYKVDDGITILDTPGEQLKKADILVYYNKHGSDAVTDPVIIRAGLVKRGLLTAEEAEKLEIISLFDKPEDYRGEPMAASAFDIEDSIVKATARVRKETAKVQQEWMNERGLAEKLTALTQPNPFREGRWYRLRRSWDLERVHYEDELLQQTAVFMDIINKRNTPSRTIVLENERAVREPQVFPAERRSRIFGNDSGILRLEQFQGPITLRISRFPVDERSKHRYACVIELATHGRTNHTEEGFKHPRSFHIARERKVRIGFDRDGRMDIMGVVSREKDMISGKKRYIRNDYEMRQTLLEATRWLKNQRPKIQDAL